MYKFVFKRKIYVREDTLESEDEMYKRLDFLQACDEIIAGNITMSEEADVIAMVAQSVYVDMEEVRFFFVVVSCIIFFFLLSSFVPNQYFSFFPLFFFLSFFLSFFSSKQVPDTIEELIDDGCLMEYVPQPWKRDHTDDEWGNLIIQEMAKYEDMDFEAIQDQLVAKVRPHELFGTCFFHVKRVPYEAGAPEPRLVKGMPDVMYCAFNSDGMHFLSDQLGKSYTIIREFGFADIYRWGGSHTRFSLIIWDSKQEDTFELSLYTSQAADMAALILDYINAIMENQPDE